MTRLEIMFFEINILFVEGLDQLLVCKVSDFSITSFYHYDYSNVKMYQNIEISRVLVDLFKKFKSYAFRPSVH
jgi:hypothetical protein